MKILAIESTAKAASVCITEDERLIGQYYQNSGLTHSRTLMPMAEDILRNCEMTAEDMDVIAVARGPGSFTGVRIGVSAAKGIAWAVDKPCCGVSTLEAIALQTAFMSGNICAVMDARRNQVYNALFRAENNEITRLTPDRAVSLDELLCEMEGESWLLAGDGAQICYDYAASKKMRVSLAPEHLHFQTAYGVALAALKGEHVTAGMLVPVYLRPSQAERERLSGKEKS